MTIYAFLHYSEWPKDKWYWPDFSPREMASKREGALKLNTEAMDKLQALRNILDVPCLITSAYRSPLHNKAVGGATFSEHLKGTAFDVRMENHNPAHFEKCARKVGFTGFGFYPKSGFMHIDIGRARDWGTRWPESVIGLPAEILPLPAEVLPEPETQEKFLKVVSIANRIKHYLGGMFR